MGSRQWVLAIAASASLVTAAAHMAYATPSTGRAVSDTSDHQVKSLGGANTVTSRYGDGYRIDSSATTTLSSLEAQWTQPEITCAKTAAEDIEPTISFNYYDEGGGPSAFTDSDCYHGKATYRAAVYLGGINSETLDQKVAPGDNIYAKINIDASNKYTVYVKDATQGWEYTSPEQEVNAQSDADVAMDYSPDPDGSSTVAPVRMSNAKLNGKPIASFNPTKVNMVDGNKKVVVETSDIDTAGNFTLTIKT